MANAQRASQSTSNRNAGRLQARQQQNLQPTQGAATNMPAGSESNQRPNLSLPTQVRNFIEFISRQGSRSGEQQPARATGDSSQGDVTMVGDGIRMQVLPPQLPVFLGRVNTGQGVSLKQK